MSSAIGRTDCVVDYSMEYHASAPTQSVEVLPVERFVVIARPKPKTCFPLTLPSKSWVWGLLVVGTLGVLGLVVDVSLVVGG